MSDIILNKEQEVLVKEMLDFVITGKDKVFIVNAGGGVGKTTVVKHLCQQTARYNTMQHTLNNRHTLSDTCRINLTATTNAAVNELSTAVLDDAGNYPASINNICTIFSLLGLRVYNDMSNGKTTLTTKKDVHPVLDDSVVIIDEASMLTKEIEPWMNKLRPNMRIILLGDAEQLLGVGEPVAYFYKKYPKHKELLINNRANEKSFKKYVASLRMNVRNKELKQVRDCVGDTLIRTDDSDIFNNTISEAYKYDPSQCRTISFTNVVVNEYMEGIRKNVLGLPPKFVVGDYAYTHNILSIDSVNSSSRRLPANSLIKIVEIGEPEEFVVPHSDISITCRVATIRTSSLDNREGILIVEDEYQVKQALKVLGRTKQFGAYFYLKECFLMLRLPYVSTVHKAQGASVRYVFVDLQDLHNLRYNIKPDTVARLIYVAISRAKEKCFILGEIPERLLGSYK